MKSIKETPCDGYVKIEQQGGATLGYSPDSGIKIIEVDGYAFKNLSKSGRLEIYEDWRRPIEERVADLVSKLSIEEIAGLMLYSSHEAVPATSYDVSNYGGKPYAESGAKPSDISDNQRRFLKEDYLRHILVTITESPAIAAKWNNNIQAYVEGLAHGIPANNSSDPRHSARSDAEFNAGGGGDISMWPGPLGLGATFSPQTVRRFGEIASKEYRLMGFTTALSPQIDLATEPRWYRCHGTFGEDAQLSTDMAQAYCDGFQTSEGEKEVSEGWGYDSVNAMVKHWPGGGACEAGRDAHYGCGKYAVYPGGNMRLHLKPFLEGAFRLQGKTQKASAVMPYYTISCGIGEEAVGNSYDHHIITDMLRGDAGYDGVVCTDWAVTADEIHPGIHSGKPWGVEKLSVAERHYKALMAGVDQFGGNYDKAPVLEAYKIGVKEHGEEYMKRRFRESARRLLLNIFRLGLFENPYIDIQQTAEMVGCAEYTREGYEAQVQSTVMLKNHNHVLPIKGRKKVYIPNRHVPEYTGFWGTTVKAKDIIPLGRATIEKYFDVVETPQEADIAILFIESPNSVKGYSLDDMNNGGNGYIPISLQYSPYTAKGSRKESIAGGDPYEKFANRTYEGKSTESVNSGDMQMVIETKRAMGSRPVIVAVNISNPMVFSEIEPYADAILLKFDCQNQVVMDIVSGRYEPSALLPMQMPLNMLTVEQNEEDTPRDMKCYIDEDGNIYDFAFGLNWSGVISDERVKKYR